MKWYHNLGISVIISGLIVISFIAGLNFAYIWFEMNPDTNGAYFEKLDVLIVNTKNREPSYNVRVAIHEVGHQVWFKKLNQTQRDEYCEIYNQSSIQYWFKSCEEDFAEAYTRSYSCGINNRNIESDRLAFMIENDVDYFSELR